MKVKCSTHDVTGEAKGESATAEDEDAEFLFCCMGVSEAEG